jgi:hypothetical protein
MEEGEALFMFFEHDTAAAEATARRSMVNFFMVFQVLYAVCF